MTELNENNFKEFAGEGNAAAEFYSSGCMPCRSMEALFYEERYG